MPLSRSISQCDLVRRKLRACPGDLKSKSKSTSCGEPLSFYCIIGLSGIELDFERGLDYFGSSISKEMRHVKMTDFVRSVRQAIDKTSTAMALGVRLAPRYVVRWVLGECQMSTVVLVDSHWTYFDDICCRSFNVSCLSKSELCACLAQNQEVSFWSVFMHDLFIKLIDRRSTHTCHSYKRKRAPVRAPLYVVRHRLSFHELICSTMWAMSVS